MSTNVLISAFSPFRTISVQVPSDAAVSSLYDALDQRYPRVAFRNLDLVFSTHSGFILTQETPISFLTSSDEPSGIVNVRLSPRCRAGKGGFGSQLRAAGGRMSSQKTSNNDSCRDLSGRRLSTIKEAKKLADYIEGEPVRRKAQQEAQKAKLEALEKKLGINSDGTVEPVAGKKHRLDDTEYIEQSHQLVDNVKNAVSAAILKKKKKAKTAATAGPSSSGSSSSIGTAGAVATTITSAASVVSAVAEPILDSAATAPVVAVVAVAAGAASV